MPFMIISPPETGFSERMETEQSLDERGLARAVFADYAEIITAVSGEIYIIEYRHAIIGKTDIFYFYQLQFPRASLSTSRFFTIAL